jgi:hypothetical protein
MKFKNIIISASAFLLVILLTACGEEVQENNEEFSNTEFPDTWAGSWKGDLVLTKNGLPTSNIKMELNIQRIDMETTTWQIVYDSIPRDYELKVARGIGHYVIDEKNSVFLDGYFENNEFNSVFSVNDVVLVTNYNMLGDSMIFTIRTYPQSLTAVTGEELEQADTANPISIKSYRERIVQRAVLYR